MGDYSLALDVYRTLRKAHYLIRRDLRKKLTEHGVTWPQFHVLHHIKSEGTSFKELARHLNCNASNMTGLIDRMEENNWVYREHSDEDRRIWLVKITEEGIELKKRLIPEHIDNIKERFSCLSEEELEDLKKLLGKLIDAN